MTRPLADDERALWARVAATVRPLRRAVVREEAAVRECEGAIVRHRPLRAEPRAGSPPAGPGGLDASWDRQLARGLARPDLAVDLHGHSMAAAHALLDQRLEQAIAAGARLVLLITGKPPREDRVPGARGAIRAAVGDWLNASRHAGDIAAIRGAHPRHGGSGALYVILRRRRNRHRRNS